MTTDIAVRPEQAQATEQVQALAMEKASLPELDYAARLGMWLAAAESNSTDPKAKGMAAALRIEYARLLDLPPHAASEIYVIKGSIVLSAKLCRALAHSRGVRVVRVDEKADSCTAAVIDIATDKELGRTTYTLAQAKKAGRSGGNWDSVPDRMLWARASKRALDDHAPWVTVGVLTEEDIQEIDGAEVVRPSALHDLPAVDMNTPLAGEVFDGDALPGFGE